jgi:hypothetical protein
LAIVNGKECTITSYNDHKGPHRTFECTFHQRQAREFASDISPKTPIVIQYHHISQSLVVLGKVSCTKDPNTLATVNRAKHGHSMVEEWD